jgi:hypothetical protein
MAVAQQTQTNWCWAAVTAGVASFYAGGTSMDQCAIVNTALNVPTPGCCQDGSSSTCNVPFFLEDALQQLDHLAGDPVDGPSTFDQVVAQIDAQQPLCARIDLSSGGGHFVALAGYSADGQYVLVLDPASGSATWVVIGDLTTKYQGSGRWTISYFTKG